VKKFGIKNKDKVKIGKIFPEDVKKIWEIRNHLKNRSNFNNSNFIPFEDHKKWLEKKYFQNKKNICYALRKKEAMVGYCRFDWNADRESYIISIAMDPENQSRGLGNKLLSGSLGRIKGTVLAKVKKENQASIKLFEKNNFKKNKETKDNLEYIKEL
jgi:ribosomal protein S18 acetylase RimI-like enzyme